MILAELGGRFFVFTMRLLSQEQIRDYSDKRVMLPLSGGINSIYQERRKAPKFYLWGYKPQIALWQSN